MYINTNKSRKHTLSSSTAVYRSVSTYCRNKLLHLLKYQVSLNTPESNGTALDIICGIIKKLPNDSKFSLDLFRVIVSLFMRLQCDTTREYLNFLRLVAETTPELRYIVLHCIANYHLKRNDPVRLLRDVNKHFVEWKLDRHEDAVLLSYMARYKSLQLKNSNNPNFEIPSSIGSGIRWVFKVYIRYKRIPSIQALELFVATNYRLDPIKCITIIDQFISLFPNVPHIRRAKYHLLANDIDGVSYGCDIQRLKQEAYGLLFCGYSPSVHDLKLVVGNLGSVTDKIDIYCRFLMQVPRSDYAWLELSKLVLENPKHAIENESIKSLGHYYDPETNIARVIDENCLINYLIVGIIANKKIGELIHVIKVNGSTRFGFEKLTRNNDNIKCQYPAKSAIDDLYKRIHGTSLGLFD